MTDTRDPVETLARLFHGPWYDSAPDQHKEVSRRNARAFISALVAEAVAKEREECAVIVENEDESTWLSYIAAAIRARKP